MVIFTITRPRPMSRCSTDDPDYFEATGRVARCMSTTAVRSPRGAPIFRLEKPAAGSGRRVRTLMIAEVEAEPALAQIDIVKADGQIQEANSAHQQTLDELETKQELYKRIPATSCSARNRAASGSSGRPSGCDHLRHGRKAPAPRAVSVLRLRASALRSPRPKELDKTVVRAGVDGRVEQFALRVGDIVAPIMRSAGILILEGAGQRALRGFRSDRSADHEGRDDRGGHLAQVEALHHHPDGGNGYP